MAHISSGNGFKFDRPASPGVVRPKGIVGKEEALRMELEALDKIKREKRHTLPVTASSVNPLPNPMTQTSTSRQEKDLIVFSESETQKEEQKDKFEDIDLEKLTKEELEKLLLDDSFGVNKMTRPSSLLGCNLSASYPGGHAFNPASFHWTPTPTHAQTPIFPSAPFPKPPCSFQNGFSPALSPFISLPAQPTLFLSFTPVQPPAALVYQQPAVTPEMAKLFDKIASTSEYLKNGRSSSMETQSGSVKSLEPMPQPSEPPYISRFEWLDLDPLNKRKEVEVEETRTVSGCPFVEESSFTQSVVLYFCRLRSKFPHVDLATNPGYVLSPVITQRDAGGDSGGSVKVSIEISDSQQPVTFTCDGNSPVDLLIMQALCWVHDDLNQVDISSYVLKVCGQEEVLQNPVEEILAGLTDAVYDLAKLYLRSFCPTIPGCTMEEDRRDSREASGTTEHLQFTLFAVHGIPATWVSSFEKYYLMCALTHNNRNLFKPVQIRGKSAGLLPVSAVGDNFLCFFRISFPISVALLPLEAMLSLSLYGVLNQNANNSPDSNKQRKGPELLGRVSMPLFDFRRVLSRGSKLLSLWTSPQVLQPGAAAFFTTRLSRADRQLLWDQRYYCRDYEYSLPKILASAPSWDWGSMGEIHSLLHHWPPLSSVSALELLDSKFADTEVRKVAMSWIESSSDDELADYLPQLVQAVKFECHLNNDLAIFLLSRALGNINIAHYLYWLLRDAVQDPAFSQRYDRILGTLLCLCGTGLRAELEKQTRLVQLLGALAEKVRQANNSTRQVIVKQKSCTYIFKHRVLDTLVCEVCPNSLSVLTETQVGEDLRQDMLALQMIRIMDRIWLQEGLDLRIVNFKCISTGKDKGMVELVPSSETLRKIQVEYGVTGSFKDKPLAEWLRKYNPAEDEYEKASENFIYTCAGCCVATYILGICDRHNDNIMLRSTGHMFHIDFGKFLGHAQMIGSFKRDRAPFVLTSDMAYVINGGERPTSRFQLFVDLCSQAYNLIRKHSNLFLNLLSLMTQSGLPELTGVQDLKYVYDALQPQTTDAEATIFFTRLIESSLGSVATKFNFFLHNLAQLRFSGLPSNDEPILSFAPRTYTIKQDGRIRDASIFSFQKRYNPDKHYTYVIRILREGQSEPQFVFRTFDEFQELHNKLTILFPLWKLPGFPSKMVLGRTHIKDVASKRKVELSSYVHNLMRGSTEVTQCDLIYTFFHPIARDDKTEGVEGLSKTLGMHIPPVSPTTGRVEGEVKLSVSYRNSTLFIMVMHIKDLMSNDGADPNPYVKTYLLPDPHKTSKRKTKITRKTRNPTFNEMLVYSGYSKETLKQRELQLSVLSAESLRENCCLGGITLSLKDFDLSRETVKWYKLTTVPYF
uniref:Phosphatidylinositol-4-phosphate 3-kinase catalytic subunit type 2 alpha n=1 Tax=Sinocyclocheilus grahami TaxID=75366 RepID=A0A672QKD5_SINGR